jgi:uncharacterized protein (DUF2235 family)
MPRNIVLCCDGTANEFARHNTNVVKLYAMLQRDPAVRSPTTIRGSEPWSRPAR